MHPMLIRTCILVTGLVQGVGFRYFALRTASELGLTGYARNLATGEVEIEAQGRASANGGVVPQPTSAVFAQCTEGLRSPTLGLPTGIVARDRGVRRVRDFGTQHQRGTAQTPITKSTRIRTHRISQPTGDIRNPIQRALDTQEGRKILQA